jgi:hypothetical protein
VITLPSNDTLIKNLFKTESSIKVDAGCTVEYNLNSMVNFATDAITNSSAEYTADIPGVDPGSVARKRYPFKKLFPVDAIVRQNRPLGAGIKYYINDDIASGSLKDPKNVLFSNDYRTYIPSEDTYYKYWVGKKGEAVDIAIKYPKTLLVNKITIKFEISHCTPAAFQVFGRNGNGSFGSALISGGSSNIKSFTDKYQAGQVNMYYTGSDWSFNEADISTSAYATLTDVKLVVTAVSGKYISVIEIAPKMVKDISSDLISFSVKKESSSTGDLLPVGNVSANSLSINLNGYGDLNPSYTLYDKTNGVFEADKKYFYKDSQINVFLKAYASSDTQEYVKIPQGVFFMKDWSISEFGEITINALDGCSFLMDTLCPDLLLKDYSVAAIVRVLLDNVGFTNYKFNTNNINVEDSLVTPKYWWTEDTKTVWEAIQELCRDIQMTAVMDDNNILQFYTRDYFYSENKSTSWTFSNEPIEIGGIEIYKPNIIYLSKEALPAANKVKVLWSAATTSNYLGDSTPLWKSETTYLGALLLCTKIDSTSEFGVLIDDRSHQDTSAYHYYLTLKPNSTSFYDNTQALLSYTGYLLIDSEIFEYDAVEYQYEIEGSNAKYFVNIESQNDIYKYRTLAKVSSEAFRPTGRYRIKSRAALGTQKAAHEAITDEVVTWESIGANW